MEDQSTTEKLLYRVIFWTSSSLTPGSIMADKGFDIQNFLVESGMKILQVNIMPFKQFGLRMSAAEVVHTPQIAKLNFMWKVSSST